MRLRFPLLVIAILFIGGCINVNVKLSPDKTSPLKEYTLQGKASEKVLVIHVRGFISDSPKKDLLSQKPSTIEEIVAMLRKAEKDKHIKAVILQIDSPGGTTAASDDLYHELTKFKERTGAKVVAAMMDVAASGGYYVSLAADRIIAHPTTVTGSIGVIFMTPKVMGLMNKIGVDVEVNKSGANKDMGSPFRQSTSEEDAMFQRMIDELAGRFLGLVAQNRKLDGQVMAEVSSGRVFLAEEALKLGLVDKIGYLSDAISEAKLMAGLPEDARVVVYRRTKYPNDNLYNLSSISIGSGALGLLGADLLEHGAALQPDFYYLWLPARGHD